MKKLIIILLACLAQITTLQATSYTLKVEVVPEGSGSQNVTEAQYEEGKRVYLTTFNQPGFKFVGWYNNDELISTLSYQFSFIMPSADVTLQARYEFSPDLPGDPDDTAIKYEVKALCKPEGAGSVTGNYYYECEGTPLKFPCSASTGFKFLRWENEDGEVLSNELVLYYTVPDHDSKVYSIFELDPDTPSNPSKNSWDPETGTLIIDDFNPGSLYSEAYSALKGSAMSEVKSLIVIGPMITYDFNITNYLSNCISIDLSRATGITQIPNSAFAKKKIESISLPATIESIGSKAFENCSNLKSVTIYALTPPSMSYNIFSGVSDDLTIYVPEAVVSLYEEASIWQYHPIKPIEFDVRALTVSMPATVNPNDYTDMWLELVNVKTAQKIHYVMTNKSQYIFPNIICNTTWNVKLRNQAGDVFGSINNVEIIDEDVSVTFDTLSKPLTANLAVMSPEGIDVTDQVTITWLDNQGNYIAQGQSLTGLSVGKQLGYSIGLSKALAMQFSIPEDGKYTMKESDNNLTLTLTTLSQVSLQGQVVDNSTMSALSNATISVSQTFANKYTQTQNVKTNAMGYYAINVPNVPTKITASLDNYVSKTIECEMSPDASNIIGVSPISLTPIKGAAIELNFTFKPSVEAGETATVQNSYGDYMNISYTVYNKTTGKAINEHITQGSNLVLLEEVAENDEIEITAISVNSSFEPVTATATITNEQKGNATFNIVERGVVIATYSTNANSGAVSSLYDCEGKLVNTYVYSNKTISICNIADGNYTLITMGKSEYYNAVYDFSQLNKSKLTAGVDYITKNVAINSGTISKVEVGDVPLLDESKLYYTGENTSFSANQSSIVIGNYLTLTANINFKQVYGSDLEDVNLIVDLPESIKFIENSLLVGNSTGIYAINGNQITVPLEKFTECVRFCVIPMEGGNFKPSASVSFNLKGESITQPIGSAHITAKALTLGAPKITAETTIPVNGTAPADSKIEIIDNGTKIGETTTLLNGIWSLKCELANTENLSTHNIWAIASTPKGLELKSEVKECIYDKDAILIKTVTMLNTPFSGKECETVFDFQNPNPNSVSYSYYPQHPTFTFLIDFTNNNPELVENIVLYVYTSDGKVTKLYPIYVENIDKWVAKGNFYSKNTPINVALSYDTKSIAQSESQKIGKKNSLTISNLKSDRRPEDEDEDGNGRDQEIENNPNPIYSYLGGNAVALMDPSGYVYEAVASNRLEGVMATVFYKEEVEDAYGDLYENIVKWDAEKYAQENPQFTDEYGRYAWDVPTGLWQVKYEKAGYETAFSEWLPVPPPQLDVNIPLEQNLQPNVKVAHAFEHAVEFEFDKYMVPAELTTNNIIVQANGVPVAGAIVLLDEEVTYEGEETTYASKVRFNADHAFDAGEVTLMVSNKVQSYAGIRMQNDFMQTFTVEKEIEQILCNETESMVYGDNIVIPVKIEPVAASAGRKLYAVSSSDFIISIEETEIEIDENGMAYVSINGNLPGMALVKFSVNDCRLEATTLINVTLFDETPEESYILGDANGDGSVSVSDAVITVEYTLANNPSNFNFKAADVNMDNNISVTDVVGIVNIVLGVYDSTITKKPSMESGNNLLQIEGISLNADILTIPVMLNNSEMFTAMQFDVQLPKGMVLDGVYTTARNSSHTALWNSIGFDTYRVMVYSLENINFKGNSDEVLTLNVRTQGAFSEDSEVGIINALASTGGLAEYTLQDCKAALEVSGICSIQSECLTFWSVGRTLYVKSSAPGIAALTTIDGITYKLKLQSGTNEFDLPHAGVYILNNKKILVK